MMTNFENQPFITKALELFLSIRDPLYLPFFAILTAKSESLEIIAKKEGQDLDKNPHGVMKYPNEFAGGERSAFCPINHPVWSFREILKKRYGDSKVRTFSPEVINCITEYCNNKNFDGETEIADFTRKIILLISAKVIFNHDISDSEAQKICDAYLVFNNWCSISTILKGVNNFGRNKNLNYANLIKSGKTEFEVNQRVSDKDLGLSRRFIIYLCALFFQKYQKQFDQSLQTIAEHFKSLWQSTKQNNPNLCNGYMEKASEIDLDESAIILELTNVIGGAISSPTSYLGYCLSVYARLPRKQKNRIYTDKNYRSNFYLEIQRFYQPLHMILRDTTLSFDLDQIKNVEMPFVFLTNVYNRRKDIWGEDAHKFNPDRFENSTLSRKIVFFSKGKRRCPAGKLGELIAENLFEHLIQHYDISAEGDLQYRVAESISPAGKIKLKKFSTPNI